MRIFALAAVLLAVPAHAQTTGQATDQPRPFSVLSTRQTPLGPVDAHVAPNGQPVSTNPRQAEPVPLKPSQSWAILGPASTTASQPAPRASAPTTKAGDGTDGNP